MLVVAVGALDQALQHAMAERHIELGLLLQVAGKTKVGLRLDQQLFLRCRVVRRVAVGAAYIVLPVERICAIEMSWSGSVAGEALLVDHLRGCGFRPEIKDKLLRPGIFRVVVFRFQFCIRMRFARAVTPFAIGAGARFGYISSSAPLRGVRVGGFRNLLARHPVAMKASLSSCQRADIGLGGSLSGNDGELSCGRLLLSENDIGPQLQQGQS